jgi:hypothetical protein
MRRHRPTAGVAPPLGRLQRVVILDVHQRDVPIDPCRLEVEMEQVEIPMELWGVWLFSPADGEPRWLQHIDAGDGPIVFFTREDAEAEAEEWRRREGDGAITVRIRCVPEELFPGEG